MERRRINDASGASHSFPPQAAVDEMFTPFSLLVFVACKSIRVYPPLHALFYSCSNPRVITIMPEWT